MKQNTSKTRGVYYFGLTEDGKSHREQQTLAFAKKMVTAMAKIDPEVEPFFGIGLEKGDSFQLSGPRRGTYYVELVFQEGHFFKYTYCRLEKVLELLTVAWHCEDAAQVATETPSAKWYTRHAVNWASSKPGPRPDDFTVSGVMKKLEFGKTLGHGDHWRALSDCEGEETYQEEFDRNLYELHRKIVEKAKTVSANYGPWTEEPKRDILQYNWHPEGSSVDFAAIVQIMETEKLLSCRSIFPVLPQSCKWLVKVEEVGNEYGDFEGLICGSSATTHYLQWFAPDFLPRAHEWAKGGVVSVNLAGLALQLEKYAPKPTKIDGGPRLEYERQRLREAGEIKAAERLKHLTLDMRGLRILNTGKHDHATLVGRILEIREVRVKTSCEVSGYILEIEVYNDEPETGWVLPVYAFPSALGKYKPRRGDVVIGTAWLQGHYGHAATEAERAIFAEVAKGYDWVRQARKNSENKADDTSSPEGNAE